MKQNLNTEKTMIKLDNNYSISGDIYNWTLNFEEERTNKEGKKYTTTEEWYFPKLSQALNKYINQSLKVSESVEDLINKLNDIEKPCDKIK